MTENEFLHLLEKTLMADSPLSFDEELPEHIYDSTGKLIIIGMFMKVFQKEITAENLMGKNTPKEIYGLLQKLS